MNLFSVFNNTFRESFNIYLEKRLLIIHFGSHWTGLQCWCYQHNYFFFPEPLYHLPWWIGTSFETSERNEWGSCSKLKRTLFRDAIHFFELYCHVQYACYTFLGFVSLQLHYENRMGLIVEWKRLMAKIFMWQVECVEIFRLSRIYVNLQW